MTTTWPTVRAWAVPALLLGAAVGLLLTNDTASPDAARSFAGTVADWPAWARDAVAAVSEGGLVVLGLLLVASSWRALAGAAAGRHGGPGGRASCWRSPRADR
ncbi:hypothetical protein [Blastococcus sp. SYSU DS0533]